ncbi:MAG: class I mannose-6-phosphate isomerase [Clostridia bacterium]|nr:class I mannose-6-phosphate isomerase [Clostridia bacterium]
MKTVKLTPALKSTLWGGQRLKALYGGADMENIAESWVLSCHQAGPSVVTCGEYAGKTLDAVIRENGKAALGAHCKTEAFPVLIKFIDAADKLSVQVHPDDTYARVHENEFGKTECWYILDCDPGAELIFGMEKTLTKAQFRACIEEQTLLDAVRHVKVKKGDFAFIPAGTLHAIGKGILLAEVQQSSDTTYRVYDYGRLQNGKPRQLHIKKAVDVTDLTPSDPSLTPCGETTVLDGYTKTLLADCPYFTLYKADVNGTYTDAADADSFVSVVVTDGSGVYTDADGSLALQKGDSLFIPAGKGDFTITGAVEILRTSI